MLFIVYIKDQTSTEGFTIRFSSSSGCNEDGLKSSTPCYEKITSALASVYFVRGCNYDETTPMMGRYVFVVGSTTCTNQSNTW